MGKKDESDDERSEKHIRSEYMGDDDYRERSHYEKDKKGKTEKSLRKRIKDRINAVIHRKDIKQQKLQAEEAEEAEWRQAASNRIMDFYVTYSDWDSLKKAVAEDFDKEMTALGQEKRDKRTRKNPLCETNELARRLDFALSLFESKVKEEAVREEKERKQREEKVREMNIEQEKKKQMEEEKKRAEQQRIDEEMVLREMHYHKYMAEMAEITPEKRPTFGEWSKEEQRRRFLKTYNEHLTDVEARRERCDVDWDDVLSWPATAARVKARFRECRSYTFGCWLLEWRKMLEEAKDRQDEMKTLDEQKLIMDSVKEEYEKWRAKHIFLEFYKEYQWEETAHFDPL